MPSICISHKEDVDGICSATLVKAAFDIPKVVLVDYANLLSKLEKVAAMVDKNEHVLKLSSGSTGKGSWGTSRDARGRRSAARRATDQSVCLAEAEARRKPSVIKLAQASRIVVLTMTLSAKFIFCFHLERSQSVAQAGPVLLETAWTKKHPAGQQRPVQEILQKTSPSCAGLRNGAPYRGGVSE